MISTESRTYIPHSLMEFPYVARPPEASEVPVVVSSPHSGSRIPESTLASYALDPRGLLRDGDLYVDELYRDAVEAGATLISTPWSRFLVDLNRMEHDVASTGVEGAADTQGDGLYGERGVIWSVTTRGETIYRKPLSVEEFESRIRQYYRPYHALLRAELTRLRQKFGFAILLDAHSMPSRATKLHADPGRKRPDIIPGDLHGRSCAGTLSLLTQQFWQDSGFTVAMNYPYAGGAITRMYGEPGNGIHAIQLELNRRLYMNESTMQKIPEFTEMQDQCSAFVRLLTRWTP